VSAHSLGTHSLEISWLEAEVVVGADKGWGWNRMFHFGGSSHCVLFRKGVKVSGFPEPSDHNVPVRSRLCVVE